MLCLEVLDMRDCVSSAQAQEAEMTNNHFPPGWDEERVRRVLAHYETQIEEEAVIEDKRAFKSRGRAVIEVPVELMPVIHELIAQYEAPTGT